MTIVSEAIDVCLEQLELLARRLGAAVVEQLVLDVAQIGRGAQRPHAAAPQALRGAAEEQPVLGRVMPT